MRRLNLKWASPSNILGQPVRCELTGEKTYDRFVGTCYLGDDDIGTLGQETVIELTAIGRDSLQA